MSAIETEINCEKCSPRQQARDRPSQQGCCGGGRRVRGRELSSRALGARPLPLLLDSILKWYPTDKVFKARVHTKAQAAMLLAKMRELYPASTDLPLTLEAAGEWNPACAKEVAVVPTDAGPLY